MRPALPIAAIALTAGLAAGSLVVRPSRSALGEAMTFEVPRRGPIPERARSLVVSDPDGIAILSAPDADSPLAGHTLPRASFPILGTRENHLSCRRLWVRIGPEAWICGERAHLSVAAPPTAERQAIGAGDLPWSYAFTAHDGARAYRSLTAALAGSNDAHDFESWEANWGVAIERDTINTGTDHIVRTRSGRYLRRGEVYRSMPSPFSGASFAELSGREPGVPFGWVALGDTFAYPEPTERGEGEQIRRLSRVHVYSTRRAPGGHVFARIGADRWVRADHVRWIAPLPAPAIVDTASGERWIDVDLATQTLIAYEGTQPVFATLVSSGGDRFPTDRGVFRIWGRYLAHTMDNTESEHLPNHFRLGDVPYVLFFDHDRALHGVYWHDQFGVARSHGCINLSLADAAWLFEFTAVPLAQGWSSRSIPAGSGTVVRVRGRYVE